MDGSVVTERSDRPPATEGAERLDPVLARRFHVEDVLWSAPGTVVFRCRRRGPDPVLYAVKQSAIAPRPGFASLRSSSVAAGPGLLLPEEDGTIDGRFWSVTPFQLAGTLADREPVTSPAKLEQLLGGLAAALAPLHDEGFAHADIHPGNIVFPDDTWIRPMVLDFDLVVEGPVTLTGPVDGVAAYQPPEALAYGQVTIASDWWAVGMVLVERLVGRHPFGGPDVPVSVVQQHHANSLPYILDEVSDDRWAGLLRGLLEPSPTRRWGPEEVRAWLEGRPTSAAAGSGVGRPYEWEGVEARSPEGLGLAVLGNWEASGERLRQSVTRDAVARWVESCGASREVSEHLDRGPRGDSVSDVDAFLTRLVVLLAPSIGPCFAGERFTMTGLAALGQLGVLEGAAGESQRRFIVRLHEAGALRDLAALPHQDALASIAETFDRSWHDTQRALKQVARSVEELGSAQRRELVALAGCAVLGTLLDERWSEHWGSVLAGIDVATCRRTPWFAALWQSGLHPSAQALLGDRLQPLARAEAESR